MQSLGTLGGASSSAAGINTFGSVVGHSQTSRDHEDHAFLWNPATFAMRDIAPLNDQTVPSIAERINDAGTMVGSTGVPGPANPLAVYWDAGSLTMHTIPVNTTYPDSPALGNDINNSGEMVGEYLGQDLAFTYAHGAVKTFTVFTASSQSATGVNDNGMIVGWGGVPVIHHAFALVPGHVPVDLGTFSPSDTTTQSMAYDVSNGGWVVGVADQSTTVGGHHVAGQPFFWGEGLALYNLGTLPGAMASAGETVGAALGINPQRSGSSILVAGWSLTTTGKRHAVVWSVEIGHRGV